MMQGAKPGLDNFENIMLFQKDLYNWYYIARVGSRPGFLITG